MTEEERQLRKDFFREFDLLNKDMQSVILEIDKATAWAILGQLQLALRHPANKGMTSQQARKVAEQIEAMIAVTPALKTVAARGWLEVYDE